MLNLYRKITAKSEKPLTWLLNARLKKGKEDEARLNERMGAPLKPRPDGKLIWIHAASVGEAQSALILIDKLSNVSDASIMVTSGTRTSAELMVKRLPANAFHQYMPLDHPEWINRFLYHWKPNAALWIESELWPNTLSAIEERAIPTALINARLSDKSFKGWSLFKKSVAQILSPFTLICTQSDQDTQRFQKLGGENVVTAGNIKYSAAPLPHDEADLSALKNATSARPIWVYASTHDGEEALACRIHERLKRAHPNLLTIIIPRHPERGNDIETVLKGFSTLKYTRRGEDKAMPAQGDDIYLADTLGELGLFYRLADIAMIGRSFSSDGGGGHNPLEAAQLHCAVLTGPNIQFQRDIFDDMFASKTARHVTTKEELADALDALLKDQSNLADLQKRSYDYAMAKTHVIDDAMKHITPFIQKALKL